MCEIEKVTKTVTSYSAEVEIKSPQGKAGIINISAELCGLSKNYARVTIWCQEGFDFELISFRRLKQTALMAASYFGDLFESMSIDTYCGDYDRSTFKITGLVHLPYNNTVPDLMEAFLNRLASGIKHANESLPNDAVISTLRGSWLNFDDNH